MKSQQRFPITVFLADDHQIVIKGIASLLELDPELQMIGCTTDSTQIIDQVARLKPDVLVLDLMMPDIPGVEIIRSVNRTRSFRTKIVVFTMHKDTVYVAQALQEGALGFVVKDTDSSHLINAIKAVSRGEPYFSPPITRESINDYLKQLHNGEKDKKDILKQLTRREREILIFVAQGRTNQEIADKLCISVRTAEKHRYNMMRKANFKDKADVVHFAIRKGLIT